ncbi:MAG: hypothetical protein ACKVPJ_00625 [Chitinophagales bacterium]
MKRTFYIFCLVATIAIFPSCEKCTICTYIDQSTGEEVIEEYCGSEKQVSNFEEDFELDWINHGGYCLRY